MHVGMLLISPILDTYTLIPLESCIQIKLLSSRASKIFSFEIICNTYICAPSRITLSWSHTVLKKSTYLLLDIIQCSIYRNIIVKLAPQWLEKVQKNVIYFSPEGIWYFGLCVFCDMHLLISSRREKNVMLARDQWTAEILFLDEIASLCSINPSRVSKLTPTVWGCNAANAISGTVGYDYIRQ